MRISHGPQLVQYELSRSRGLGDKPAATPGVLFLAAPSLRRPAPQIRLFLVDGKSSSSSSGSRSSSIFVFG